MTDRAFYLLAGTIATVSLIVALFFALPEPIKHYPGTFTEADGTLVVDCDHPKVACEGR